MAVTASERPIPSGEGLTFEKVWAMFQETDRRMQETDRRMQETDRRMQETDRLMKENAESQKKTDRQITRLSKQMGGLHNSFGEMAEHLVVPGIAERFNELGYHFNAVAPGGYDVLGG